jgi:KDO2-lipid IV(A) lauroyltransferase
MARVRSATFDWAVYGAVRVLVMVVQAVPPPVALGFARFLGAAIYHLDRRHREIARDNLNHAFPELSAAAIDRLVRKCLTHYAQVFVEMLLLPRKLGSDNWRTYAKMSQSGPTVQGLLERRPLLIVTAHFGNWELAGYALGLIGFRTYAIARVLDNPHLERFLKRFRQMTGQTIIAKKADFDRLADVLRNGGKVATLADQDAGPRGVFVPFFGRPASAHKAVALMAMEFDAKMVVVGVPRVGQGFEYAIHTEDVIDPRDYVGRPDAVQAITARYHAALERMVRRHPEQYFWLHRRWKTRPAVRNVKRAA